MCRSRHWHSSASRARGFGLEHELERHAERAVEPLAGLSAAGSKQRLDASRELFPRGHLALLARGALVDDALESFGAQVFLELVGRELDRALLAAIADEPDARRVEPQEPGRVHPVAAEDRLFAGRADDDEFFDRAIRCAPAIRR